MSPKRSADQADLSTEADLRKRIAVLEQAEERAAAEDRRERAEEEKAKAAAAKAGAEAAEQERKEKEEEAKAERVRVALKKNIEELEKRALLRKAEKKGLPTSPLTVNKGTRYEETFEVVWSFVGPLANGTACEDDERMAIIEKLEGFLDKSDTWSRIVREGIQLFSIQFGKQDGEPVLRVTYDGYAPDYNDECPYDDDDQSDDWEGQSCYTYFDVDMYGRITDCDVPTGCYVKALKHLESKGWMTIHSK